MRVGWNDKDVSWFPFKINPWRLNFDRQPIKQPSARPGRCAKAMSYPRPVALMSGDVYGPYGSLWHLADELATALHLLSPGQLSSTSKVFRRMLFDLLNRGTLEKGNRTNPKPKLLKTNGIRIKICKHPIPQQKRC